MTTPQPIRLSTLAERIRASHEHVAVADVNDHRVILAVNEHPFPWHSHDASDELFLVLEGTLRIEFEDESAVDLGPQDTFLVPAGTMHRTIPNGRCVNLIFERANAATRFRDDSA